jgi:hypothetical protein
LTLLTMLFFGTETYRQYIVEVLPALDSYRSAWPGISLGNFWCRLFDPSPVCGVTIALANNPMLARTLTLGSSVVVVGLLGWVILRAHQATSFDRCYTLSMVAMVLVSPVAWDHYLVFLVLPVLLFWNQLSTPRLRGALILILLPLVLHRYLFWASLVCDPRLDWTHQVAQPWQALTALSIQTYALLAWFLLGAATTLIAPTARSIPEDLILCPS